MMMKDENNRENTTSPNRHTEAQFRRTFDQAPIGAAIISLEYRFLRVNEKLCAITGYQPEELLQLSFPDITYMEDLEEDIQLVQQLVKGEIDQYQLDKRYVRKNGELIWARLSVRLIRDDDGNPLFFLPMIENINEQKLVEAALKEKEIKLRRLIESSKTIPWEYDIEQDRFTFVGPQICSILGISPSAWNSLADWAAMIHPEDRERSVAFCMTETQQGRDHIFEYRTLSATGDIVWLRDDVGVQMENNRPVRLSGFISNITERKLAEESQNKTRAFINSTLESITDLFYAFDLNGKFIRWNKTFATVSGYSDQELELMKPQDFFSGDGLQRISEAIEKVYKDGSSKEEACFMAKDGRQILCEFNGSVLKDGNGNILGFSGTGRDITERALAEEKLLQQRTTFEHIFEQSLAGYWDWMLQENTEYLSPTFKSMFGYQDHELSNSPENWQKLIFPEDLPGVFQVFEKHISSHGEVPFYNEVRYRHKNGSTVWVICTGKVIEWDSEGQAIRMVGCHIDITERKRAEETLQQKNQELEQFVYTVSHDLKSPLITVKTYAGMLRQDLQGDGQPQINEDLDYIDKAADKIQQLLDALSQYSCIGRNDAPVQTLSASQSVENCLTTLAGILLQHEVQVSTSELPQKLHGDPLHFGQIWQNLIENAVKYSGDQARPQIEIGAMQQSPDDVFYVRDNGIGIAPKHRERIFNLFSQLNPGSEGSGLGLALVKKIVSIYQGRIWVESAGDGRGSCFMFTLPSAVINNETTT